MSVKKDRFNKRKHRNAKGNFWTVPKDWIQMLNRGDRAKERQLMRVGRYDEFPRRRKDAGWLYW